MPEPIYATGRCRAAYQLDWSYSLFWRVPPAETAWFEPLRDACAPDGIRLLQFGHDQPRVSQFLVSTPPHVPPLLVAQRVKGRLQHLLRPTMPAPFQRNYALRSIGSTRAEKLDRYLAGQLAHHPFADARTTERLARYQIHNPAVDLSRPRATSHARFWYNLHLVFVHAGRYRDIDEDTLGVVRDTLRRVAAKKGHLLWRAALLADHVHVLVGCGLEESPEAVALGYLNNLACARGQRPFYEASYFVGTFSEYDLGVIPRPGEPA